MRPDAVTVSQDGRTLVLEWAAGGCARVDAGLLWAQCPSAQGRRRRLDARSPNPPAGLTILTTRPIGHYAINIVFSDGHDRGVYPWALLSALAQRPKAEDFIIAAAADAA